MVYDDKNLILGITNPITWTRFSNYFNIAELRVLNVASLFVIGLLIDWLRHVSRTTSIANRNPILREGIAALIIILTFISVIMTTIGLWGMGTGILHRVR